MKFLSQAAIVALLLASGDAHKLSQNSMKVTDETASTINDAVKDVLSITQDAPRVKVNHSEEHHMDKNVVVPGMSNLATPRYGATYNGAYGPVAGPYAAPKSDWIAPGQPQTVEVPKPVPVPVPAAKQPNTPAPNSSVMRAIADANMQSAVDKVTQQRDVANKMEMLERQAAINDQINESVKREEQRVIDAANRRMAEVHAKKAEEANAAFKAIEAAANERKATEEAARKKELDAVKKIRSTHASNVVA